MEDTGKSFYRKRWVSICSAHQEYNKECKTCNKGTWNNVWMLNISKLIYKKAPKLWVWLIEKGIFK